MSAINNYSLPVPKNELQRIDRISSPAHVGKLRNAIDFIVAENTPVLAEQTALLPSSKMTRISAAQA